jgi:hypothetical protein
MVREKTQSRQLSARGVVAQTVALNGRPIWHYLIIRSRLVVEQLICELAAQLVLLPLLHVRFDFFPGPIDRTELLGLK